MFDWLSRDEAVVSLYQSDEKCNFVFTATGFRDLFTLITKANNPVTFRKTPKDLPLLFISGDKDPVGRYGEGVRRTVNLYRGNGVKLSLIHILCAAGARAAVPAMDCENAHRD